MRPKPPFTSKPRFIWKTAASICFPSRSCMCPTPPSRRKSSAPPASCFLTPVRVQQRLYFWRRRVLGSDRLGGSDSRRLLLQPPRLGPAWRLAHASLGERVAGGNL